ncbi:MAG: EAL domain-containing protein [Pseudomonadota bacterium]
MPNHIWDRLPFVARLLVTACAALLVAGVAMLYVSAHRDAHEAETALRWQMDNELRGLASSIADEVVIGDFASLQQNLDRQAKRTGIGRIVYRDASNAVLESRGLTVGAVAPAWFAGWMGLQETTGRTELEIGGRYYGSFELTLSPQQAINRAWKRLLQHLSVLLLAILLDFLGIWLVLRLGLKPLRTLDAGSQALAAGDFSTRLPLSGSPELRRAIAAFNHMADEVQGTVKALAESEGRVSAILKSIGDGLIATDRTMRVTYVNPIAESLTGWMQAEAAGRGVAEVFRIEHALTRQPAEIPVARVLETGHVVGLANHTVLVARDGRRYHISDSAAPIRDADGEMVGVVMVFRDVSESYRLRTALEASQARLALALKGADLGLWDWNVLTGDLVLDERSTGMLGYHLDAIPPEIGAWERLVHPDDLPQAKRALETHLQGLSPQYEAEHRMLTKQGDWRWVLSRGRVTERDAEGKPLRVTGTHLDITERKGAQAEIERLAFFDPLTGLPNRRLMLDRLRHELAAARRNQRSGALLFIDLDHFKHINDARGHAVGDQLLREVANRLVMHRREVDTVSRLGGDEFVVLLPDLAGDINIAATAARNVADKLRASLGELYVLDGGEHYLSVSIGVALFPDGEDETCESLLRHADTAMYRAKECGRNTVSFFEPQMQLAVEHRLALEHELHDALAKKEFQLHLQAQHDRDGRLVGAEVLLRWNHPTRGMVPPSSFIPLAEETGMIVSIGDWVLAASARLLKELETAGHDLRLSVNVSPRQFQEADFVMRVREILSESGASPQRLTLEITEGMLMGDAGEAIARMAELEHLGVHFSIDDFGTGYSSLSYLKRLPLSELKIDRGFVSGLPRDPDDAALVVTILLIARQMGLEVVAEGVENEAQLEYLKERGCDHFQGYLLGRPMPVEEFLRTIA